MFIHVYVERSINITNKYRNNNVATMNTDMLPRKQSQCLRRITVEWHRSNKDSLCNTIYHPNITTYCCTYKYDTLQKGPRLEPLFTNLCIHISKSLDVSKSLDG